MSEPLATWWRQNSAGVNYWRCEIPAKHLPGRVNQLTMQDLAEDENGEPCFPYQAGRTAIWPFAGNATRALLMAQMQELGYRVLMEVDDLYLVRPAVMNADWQEDFARGGPGKYGDRHSIAAHREISGWVDGVICSTDVLAGHYRKVNESVFVCPNSVDPDDWPEPLERAGDTLRIGWAASKYHHVDEHLVRAAMEWAASQPRVEVYTFGYQPMWAGRINRVPWTNSIPEYRRSLVNARLDVAICPVQPTQWADCKSDVKALEAAMSGAFPVVSSVAAYRMWHGPTIRCESPSDWRRALKWCVANLDEVRARGREAREYVLRERTIDKSIGAWKEAVQCAYVRQV